jgi:hypothetical protein
VDDLEMAVEFIKDEFLSRVEGSVGRITIVTGSALNSEDAKIVFDQTIHRVGFPQRKGNEKSH